MSRYDRPDSIDLELDFGILGEQTCEIKYWYSPEDDGGRDYPSSPEEFAFESANIVYYVKINGEKKKYMVDVSELISDAWDEIVDRIKDEASSYDPT